MLTNKDYCDYETCVALRELGYKGISRYFYATKESPLRRYSYDQILTTRIANAVGHTLAISLYVAQKFLREEKHIEVVVLGEKEIGGPYYAYIYTEGGDAGYVNKSCEKYEEALSEGLRTAVEILKEK